ncbi:MAG: MarR family winged helix-turn-helix transcriptional regulator, partial [Asticcacaulis sp.]
MSLDERFSKALHSSARAWRAALDRRMRDLGISQAGWVAIAYIAKSEAPMSQSELAALVQVEAATMVSTLDKLEASGLVARAPSGTDRRVKHVGLTDAGREVYDRVKDRADG